MLVNPRISKSINNYHCNSIGFDGGVNSYLYVAGNPVVRIDESEKIWDTIADAGFIIYDLGSLAYHSITGDEKSVSVDKLALGADITGALILGATGLGLGVRAGVRSYLKIDYCSTLLIRSL